MPAPSIPWSELATLLHRDPGGRGLASYRTVRGFLDEGELEGAATSLAQRASAVAIVTGFCIPFEGGWAAETDGPPGALFLARALTAVGAKVRLVSDEYGRPLLESGTDAWGLPRSSIEIVPFESPDPQAPERQSNASEYCRHTDAWVERFLASEFGRRLTHVIAIERCGPSHTVESLAGQRRNGPPPLDRFQRLVPTHEQNVCHNMRGQSIDAHTAKTHRLFEAITDRRLPVTTIGIADGGNELGTGALPWETVADALGRDESARIVCRVPADYLLLAGVSNWAGYALALATCATRGRWELARTWNSQELGRLIETLVLEAGAVNGVTRRREPQVDGIPLESYLATFRELRGLFGLG